MLVGLCMLVGGVSLAQFSLWFVALSILGFFIMFAGGMMAFGGGSEIGRMDRHTEFATGVDWCLFGAEGWCTTCAWDERVLVWDVREYMRG